MKIKLLSALLLPVLVITSCSGIGGKSSGDSLSDTSMHDITRPTGENYIEDLLTIKDENELKSKFGDHVSYDTIWGAEGNYTMGTYLDQGTVDEVQIWWNDSLHRSKVGTVVITAWNNEDGKYNYNSKWSSKTGVHLGMTTSELEELNKKGFSFSGFDWDFGGGVMGWNNGKIEYRKVGVTLTQGDGKITEDENMQVLGDQEVKSDNVVVRKMQPRVVRVSVY
jgi:hypothetical protein